MLTPASSRAIFEVSGGTFSLNIPHPQFTDLIADNWTITPNATEGGSLHVRQWPEDEIERYGYEAESWAKYGQRVSDTVQAAFSRRIVGGLVGKAMSLLEIPTRKPADRGSFFSNIHLNGGGVSTAVGIDLGDA